MYGLMQNLVLMSPKVKRICGIPKSPSEVANPYTYVVVKLRERFSFKKTVASNSQ